MDETTIIMRLHEVAIRELMRLKNEFPEHASRLDMIHYDWSRNMTRAAGNARPHSGRIRFSIKIWTDRRNQANIESEFRNTVLHEIAHVLTPGHGHDATWQRVALEIGCNGERYHELATPKAQRPKKLYPWTCCVCGEEILLGPGQYRMAKYEGRTYRHRTCI
tara:strand:- start:429 stop:917 length:489 start_codon:yes stop_codon:yes gene_type:complete